jgi:hypothetical protein
VAARPPPLPLAPLAPSTWMSAVQLLLEDALLAAARLGLRRPFMVEASGLQTLLAERIEAGTAVAAFAVDLLRRMSG